MQNRIKCFACKKQNGQNNKGVYFMSKSEKHNVNKPETTEMAPEEMTVELELDNGSTVTCTVVTIYTVDQKDYIALLPLDENGENHDGNVWIYGYSENPDDPNEEPVLRYIEDDEEYERAADGFDEYLDNTEFDEMI